MSTTDNPNDPRLTRGVDNEPAPQADAYLVLSKEERAKGFVRPYRDAYKHIGRPGPTFALRNVTEDEQVRFGYDYVRFEVYPPGHKPHTTGRFWTQDELDAIGKGCGMVTTMGRELSETYARQPGFYGATYCAFCKMHRPVSEFIWSEDGQRVGS